MVLCTLAGGVVSSAKAPPQTFQAALDRFVAGKDQLVPAWRQLHTAHWPDDPSYIAQMLATTDAMVGRYAQARQEFERAFDRPQPKSVGCSNATGQGTFQD
jgi:hypothetical protein